MSLGKVSIAIEAQMASFESDMGRAARVAEKNFKKMERDAKKTEESMKRVGKVIGLALVAGATAAAFAIKGAINAMDDMSKAAQRANMPTEDFSRLAFAGKLADVSMEDLTGSLGKLAKAQGDAMRATSVQARVFEGLGIAVKNADGSMRSTAEVFKDFADVFQQMKGSPEIMAAGMNIFGRSFQKLIPLLKDGSQGLREAGDEADRFGATVSTKAGKDAELFNDELERIGTIAAGVARDIAGQLLPQLNEAAARLKKLAEDGDIARNAVTLLGGALNLGVGILEGYANAVDRTSIAIGLMINAGAGMKELRNNILSLGMADGSVAGGYNAVGGAFKDGQAQLDALIARQNKVPFTLFKAPEAPKGAPDTGALRLALSGGPAKAKKAGTAKKSDAEREAEQLQRAYESLMATQAERIALFGKESEVSKVTYDTQFGSLSKLTEAQKSELLINAERLDMMAKDAEALKAMIDLEEKATAAKDDAIKRNDELIANMEFELSLIGLSNIEREREIALRYAGAAATVEQIARIGELVDATAAAAEKQAFADDVQRGLTDAVVDYASGAKSAKEAFGDFADQLFARALQFVADKAIQAMFDSFSSNGSGGASASGGASSGGGFAGLFTSILGAFGGGRASGGPVSGSKFYEAGENNRPEIFKSRGKQFLIPGNDGNVVPIRGGGAGVVQNIAINYQAPYDARTEAHKNARIAFETNRVTARNR